MGRRVCGRTCLLVLSARAVSACPVGRGGGDGAGFPRTASGVWGMVTALPPLWLTLRVWEAAPGGASVCSSGYFHVRPAGCVLGVAEPWGDAENLGRFEIQQGDRGTLKMHATQERMHIVLK